MNNKEHNSCLTNKTIVKKCKNYKQECTYIMYTPNSIITNKDFIGNTLI